MVTPDHGFPEPGSSPRDADPAAQHSSARLEMPEALRRDVRLLGSLLGEVLVEYGGQDLLDDVERLRKAVIGARRGEITAAEVAAIAEAWELERAMQVARAFTVYFHLVNLAE